VSRRNSSTGEPSTGPPVPLKRRPPPGSNFKSVKPCRSAAELTGLQQGYLVEAVNEAKAAEQRRLLAVSRAHNKADIHKLDERHERERARDKDKIEILVSELECVKKMSSEGGLDAAGRPRSMLLAVKTMDTNRFAQENMRTVHEKWIDRLDVLDRKFINSGKPKYNEYNERNKVCTYTFNFSLIYLLFDM
jgi:hypothetical protein